MLRRPQRCSGDYFRIEICPCESLLIICTGRSKVSKTPTKDAPYIDEAVAGLFVAAGGCTTVTSGVDVTFEARRLILISYLKFGIML